MPCRNGAPKADAKGPEKGPMTPILMVSAAALVTLKAKAAASKIDRNSMLSPPGRTHFRTKRIRSVYYYDAVFAKSRRMSRIIKKKGSKIPIPAHREG